MPLPVTLTVSLDFSNGPNYGIPFTLDDTKKGILGTNVLADNSSLVVDLSDSTTQISIRRGRDIITDTYNAGQCTIQVLDPLGYFNPQNTSSPYFGYIQPLRKLRISATDANNATTYLFSGYTSEYRYSYPQGQQTGYVTITAFDAFKIFNLAAVSTVTGGVAGQGTGTRIDKILDAINWPTNMRSIMAGQTTVQADDGTRRVSLTQMKIAEFTEQGAFYIDPQGNAVFKDRNYVVASPAATAPVQFKQDGTGINYREVKFAFDDKLIYNSASMKMVGGTAQVVSNAASINTYFVHSITKDNLIMQTDADALNVAAVYVASRATTTLRIDAITLDFLDPSYSTATIAKLLAMDYFTPVHIVNTTPQGSVVDKYLQIQGLSWDITPNSMICTAETLEPQVDGFILDSAQYGILGTSTLSY